MMRKTKREGRLSYRLSKHVQTQGERAIKRLEVLTEINIGVYLRRSARFRA